MSGVNKSEGVFWSLFVIAGIGAFGACLIGGTGLSIGYGNGWSTAAITLTAIGGVSLAIAAGAGVALFVGGIRAAYLKDKLNSLVSETAQRVKHATDDKL